MSQYINIYFKTNFSSLSPLEKDFIKIGHYSRNSRIGDCIFGTAPFGSVSELNISHLDSVTASIDYDIKNMESNISKNQNLINSVERFSNDIDEKIEKIFTLNAEIDDLQSEIENAKYARNYFDFLKSIIHFSGYKLYYGCEVDETKMLIV